MTFNTNYQSDQCDSIENSHVEDADSNKSDSQHDKARTSNNKFFVKHHHSDGSGKNSRLLLVGPQTIEELVHSRQFKKKTGTSVNHSGSDLLHPPTQLNQLSRFNSSESDDLRVVIQANLKTVKTHSPVVSDKLSICSFSPERDLMHSPVNHEEKNVHAPL